MTPRWLLGLVAALAGCGGAVQSLGIPGARSSFTVERVTARGGYLDVVLVRSDHEARVFTADDGPCRALLTVGAGFIQPDLETSGKITGPNISCEIAGRGDLGRRRQPRPEGLLVTRKQATMKVIYIDEEVILARGRFPLAGLVGWSGGEDAVAIFPNTPTCRERSAGGVASIEYRPSGDPLVLVGDGPEPCPLLGLARPL